MSFFKKLAGKLRFNKQGKPDVSETVSAVIGGGPVGLIVGELVEEGVKQVKRKKK